MLNSRQLKIPNRIGWALSALTVAEALNRPSRAVYEITEWGKDFLARHPGGVTEPMLAESAAYRLARLKSEGQRSDTVASVEALGSPETALTPHEQIEAGIQRLEDEVVTELIKRLRAGEPDFFEDAVVRLMLAMGYGASENRGRRIGGTGDGGVGGVIDQDPLGLDRVYLQAKRYAEGNNVGREAIQAFVGALQDVGASKGVFITTSQFTTGAKTYADAVPSRVILIDGARLGRLMVTYRVGVQVRETYHAVELDEDFFE